MTNTLRFFALLDIISLFLLNKQVYLIILNFKQIPHETLSLLKIVLLLVIYILLFVSAAGLAMRRKFGFISYYVQFPLRLFVWIFSFGFITLISEYTTAISFDWLFRLVIILEFFRLYFTVKIHRQLF